MPASDGKGWENTLKRGLGRKAPPAGAKPVRLSDLAPPTGQASGKGMPGAPPWPSRPGPPVAPSVPLRPPGPPPQNPPGVRPAPHARPASDTWPAGPGQRRAPAPPPADAVARLQAELQKAEDARRGAEARVAELEHEVTGLLAGVPGGAGGNGNGREELERLRRELDEAHAIIRAIEQAYLAGGGDPAPEPEPPAE
ncbi:MAG: hypothetical protein ACYTKD_04420 [Planctomycetota bacterium]|jgi:hypothetical protein